MTEGRKPLLTPRPDFGLRALRPAWREALHRATLFGDAVAGVTSLGPSFALALLAAHHAGMPTTAAIACAVLGSAVVALWGGTTLGLAGPGLATIVVLVHIARDHGAVALALAGSLCGFFQLALGLLGVGRFSRFVPVTAVHAFTFGIGGIAVVQCLPDALGLDSLKELDVPKVMDHVGAQLGDTSLAALAMATLCGVATWLGGRYARRVPIALMAVAVCAVIARAAWLDVLTLPDLPLALPPRPALGLPDERFAQFMRSVFVLTALTTAETLLAAAVDERRAPGTRSDPDQELIGYGLANLLLSPLGAMPAAGSIVRASALRAAGGRTRAAALVHSLVGVGLGAVVLLTDRFIPLAALAGVVIAVSLPLLDPRPLRAVYRISPSEAIVLAGTSFVILFGDLLRGIEAGLLATLALAMLRIARFRAQVHRGTGGAPHQVSFSGPITFLSTPALEETRARLASLDPTAGVILDVRGVLVMDLTGCERFVSLVADAVDRGARVAVLGASPSYRDNLIAADPRDLIATRLCVTDRDVDEALGQARAFEMRAQVVANLERFRSEVREHYTPLFDQLADGQHPHTLFVTCVDSRVTPTMLTGAHPGELFILRCLGAMVPPPGDDTQPAEGAAVEYAVGVLGVRNIVVCGHSRCGALKAATSGQVPDALPTLKRWLAGIAPACGDLSAHANVDDATRAVTVRQLDNLRRFPLVSDRIEKGELELHAWFYDVALAELFEWHESSKSFVVMAGQRMSAVPSLRPTA